MKKSLKEHVNFIENILQKENNSFDWSALSDFNRTQIGFFQHERLVHLLITLFFGLIFFGSVITELFLMNLGILIISIILLIVLPFYVWHYFVLENSVQKLYELEKEIAKHLNNNLV